ncbi:MAG: prefoldin subunit alpha [Euryarchaeota archaeon]|nr:prefoldin subunit alpha [Euryarchaeota archaeon]
MNEQELRQAMSALEAYRVQLQSVAENLQLIQLSLEELARARETLSQYKDAEVGSDILVPIGGNSFVFAKASDNTKAIVGIGTGISMEKSMDDAMKTMEERYNELTNNMNNLSERRETLEAQAEQLSRSIQMEMQTLQGQ